MGFQMFDSPCHTQCSTNRMHQMQWFLSAFAGVLGLQWSAGNAYTAIWLADKRCTRPLRAKKHTSFAGQQSEVLTTQLALCRSAKALE
eukprot:m.246121 g.246121  ORF g.246121 m.246121 type:complete len:88 (+) comp15373_c0_seq2:1770-2033(+)